MARQRLNWRHGRSCVSTYPNFSSAHQACRSVPRSLSVRMTSLAEAHSLFALLSVCGYNRFAMLGNSQSCLTTFTRSSSCSGRRRPASRIPPIGIPSDVVRRSLEANLRHPGRHPLHLTFQRRCAPLEPWSGPARALSTVDNIRWFEVTDTRGHVENGKILHYQVTLKIGFTIKG